MPNSRPNIRSYVTNPDNFALDFFCNAWHHVGFSCEKNDNFFVIEVNVIV